MEQELKKMKINYDRIEKVINKKWNIGLFITSLILIVLMAQFISIKYSFLSIFVSSLLFSEVWRNFYILKKVKCPSCEKIYFSPFFATKENIKSLLKSNPKCVNCNYEAEIISEYKIMY